MEETLISPPFQHHHVEALHTSKLYWLSDGLRFCVQYRSSPHSHPSDVQAYLYLVGEDNPTLDGKGWEAGMAAGVERLRTARANGRE